MHVAGSAYQLIKLHAKFNNPLIDFYQVVFRLHRALLVPEHEGVVAKRLYLQIIVEIHKPCNLSVRRAAQQRLVQFPGLAGRADDQAFPVLIKDTLGDPGPSGIIFQVGPAHQTVEVDTSDIILGKDDYMVGGQLADGIGIHCAHSVKALQVGNAPVPEHPDKRGEYLSRCPCIIHCPVMVSQGDIKRLSHRIQLKTVQVGKEKPCNGHGIQYRGIERQSLFLCKMADESHIKAGIMGYKDSIPHKI